MIRVHGADGGECSLSFLETFFTDPAAGEREVQRDELLLNRVVVRRLAQCLVHGADGLINTAFFEEPGYIPAQGGRGGRAGRIGMGGLCYGNQGRRKREQPSRRGQGPGALAAAMHGGKNRTWDYGLPPRRGVGMAARRNGMPVY